MSSQSCLRLSSGSATCTWYLSVPFGTSTGYDVFKFWLYKVACQLLGGFLGLA